MSNGEDFKLKEKNPIAYFYLTLNFSRRAYFPFILLSLVLPIFVSGFCNYSNEISV